MLAVRSMVLTCEPETQGCCTLYDLRLKIGTRNKLSIFQAKHCKASRYRKATWLFKTQGTVRVLEPVQRSERTRSSPCDCEKEGATRGSKLHHVPKHQVTRQQQFIELEWKHLSSPDSIPLPVLFTSLLSGGKTWPSVTSPTFHFLTGCIPCLAIALPARHTIPVAPALELAQVRATQIQDVRFIKLVPFKREKGGEMSEPEVATSPEAFFSHVARQITVD